MTNDGACSIHDEFKVVAPPTETSSLSALHVSIAPKCFFGQFQCRVVRWHDPVPRDCWQNNSDHIFFFLRLHQPLYFFFWKKKERFICGKVEADVELSIALWRKLSHSAELVCTQSPGDTQSTQSTRIESHGTMCWEERAWKLATEKCRYQRRGPLEVAAQSPHISCWRDYSDLRQQLKRKPEDKVEELDVNRYGECSLLCPNKPQFILVIFLG